MVGGTLEVEGAIKALKAGRGGGVSGQSVEWSRGRSLPREAAAQRGGGPRRSGRTAETVGPETVADLRVEAAETGSDISKLPVRLKKLSVKP